MQSPVTFLSARLRQRLFRERAADRLPLTIHHQRIYILPTRQGWVFLLALMLMLVASVNYALSLGYALCFLLSGLFAASLLATYRNLAGLHLQGVQASDVECARDACFLIHLANRARAARQDLCFSAAGRQTTVSVAPQASCEAQLAIPTTQRGRLALGRVTISSNYPLGLWRTWCYVHSPASVVVLPRAEHPAPPPPALLGNTDGERTHRAEQGDVAGLRDYRHGDALSSIAWKAVARGRGLVVREFDAPAALGGDLELTLATTGLSDREAQVARLAAWIKQAQASGVGIRLALPGSAIVAADGNGNGNGNGNAPTVTAALLRQLALFDSVDQAA